jgi:hypothetical protein
MLEVKLKGSALLYFSFGVTRIFEYVFYAPISDQPPQVLTITKH